MFCGARMFDVFIVHPLPTADYMQLWVGGYFRIIFPRIKQGASFLLWCGDGMTGCANQALTFSVNMFYSLGSVRALPPFVCVWHWNYHSLHLAAENLSFSRWSNTNGYSTRAGRTDLGHSVLPSRLKGRFWFYLFVWQKRSPYNEWHFGLDVWTETFTWSTSAESLFFLFFEASTKEHL